MSAEAINTTEPDGFADLTALIAQKAEERASMEVWPSPRTPQKVAQQVRNRAFDTGHPLAYWRKQWLRYGNGCWKIISDEMIRQHLYRELEHAVYVKSEYEPPVPWNPNRASVTNVIDALISEVLWPDKRQEDTWVDGRDEPVLPFADCLVRVDGRGRIDHTPDYFCFEKLPFSYDAGAALDVDGRMWQFLNEMTGDDRESVEALLAFGGSRLVRYQKFQAFLVIYGETASGKGTFDHLMEALLGARHGGMSLDDYRNNGFPKEPLLGKSLMTLSDQRAQLNAKNLVELILQVTGGDKLSIRLPYEKRSIDVRLALTFMVLTNEIPLLPDNSDALLRRLLAIYTPNSYKDRNDPDLLDTLLAELPGLVNAMLDAFDRARERGGIKQPAAGEFIRELVREAGCPLRQFIGQGCYKVGSHDYYVNKDSLYQQWKDWCAQNGHKPTSSTRFAADLYAMTFADGFRIGKARLGAEGERQQYYTGIQHTPRPLVVEVGGE